MVATRPVEDYSKMTKPLLQMLPALSRDPHQAVFERESDYYFQNKALWTKAKNAYNGGRAYLQQVLLQHPSETTEEYNARVASSYNINLIKYSTSRFGDYIFSKAPRRSGGNKEIIDDFDRMKRSVNTIMRQIFDYHTIFNLVWIFVDMPFLEGDTIDLKTKAEQKIRPWCHVHPPLDVPDWCFDEFGELQWIILQEIVIDKDNPFVTNKVIKRRTLITKDYWQRFEQRIDLTQSHDMQMATGVTASIQHPNPTGVVTAIPYSNCLFNSHFNHPGIDDLLTIHDAVLAGESELLTNILKQTYGQLVLPASAGDIVTKIKRRISATDPDIDMNAPDVEQAILVEVNQQLSRTKAIKEDSEEKGISRYIQPTGATTQSIIDHDDRLVTMMMKLYGFLVGVHTTQRESAESKSVDNISLSAQLRALAAGLEELEKRIWELFNRFDSSIKVPEIRYNQDYDIHELKAVIAAIVELGNFNVSDSYQKQVRRTLTHVLDTLHHITDEDHEEIMKDIDAGKEAKDPMTFEAQAEHVTDASGSRPDGVKARNDYQKSKKASVSRSERL